MVRFAGEPACHFCGSVGTDSANEPGGAGVVVTAGGVVVAGDGGISAHTRKGTPASNSTSSVTAVMIWPSGRFFPGSLVRASDGSTWVGVEGASGSERGRSCGSSEFR